MNGASRGRRYLRFIGTAALLVTVLLAVGSQPTRRLSGPGGIPAMLIGGGIGFVGAAFAGIVIVTAEQRTPVARLKAMSYGMAVRWSRPSFWESPRFGSEGLRERRCCSGWRSATSRCCRSK